MESLALVVLLGLPVERHGSVIYPGSLSRSQKQRWDRNKAGFGFLII
jgi:hypothetical protein